MKVLVLGAGVMGTTCAWYLAEDGHEVTVVDRQSGPAMETSFANAGGVCPGFAGPWAAPGMPLKVLKWLGRADAPLVFRPRASPAQWGWLAQFLRNCTAARFAANKARMQRIAHYSRARLVALREQTGIAYDNAARGVLQIFRTEEQFEGGVRAAAVLERMAVPHRLLNAEETLAVEPALAQAQARVAGGLHLPEDETGDCRLFTERLSELLARKGVTFRFGVEVRGLALASGQVEAVETSAGRLAADAYVVALGSHASALLRPAGIRLPVYPVKGYALTARIREDRAAPLSSVVDEHTKVMITRLGDRLRAAGMAEVGGFDLAVDPRGANSVRNAARTLFPDAASYEDCVYWAGLRPMTPDGPPYLGRTPIPNLFLNAGQGSNGWTQACGSGRIVADIVSGRRPEIDLEGLTLESRGA